MHEPCPNFTFFPRRGAKIETRWGSHATLHIPDGVGLGVAVRSISTSQTLVGVELLPEADAIAIVRIQGFLPSMMAGVQTNLDQLEPAGERPALYRKCEHLALVGAPDHLLYVNDCSKPNEMSRYAETVERQGKWEPIEDKTEAAWQVMYFALECLFNGQGATDTIQARMALIAAGVTLGHYYPNIVVTCAETDEVPRHKLVEDDAPEEIHYLREILDSLEARLSEHPPTKKATSVPEIFETGLRDLNLDPLGGGE